jgi:hypothetical protein
LDERHGIVDITGSGAELSRTAQTGEVSLGGCPRMPSRGHFGEGGNPEIGSFLDSRLRGNDEKGHENEFLDSLLGGFA